MFSTKKVALLLAATLLISTVVLPVMPSDARSGGGSRSSRSNGGSRSSSSRPSSPSRSSSSGHSGSSSSPRRTTTTTTTGRTSDGRNITIINTAPIGGGYDDGWSACRALTAEERAAQDAAMAELGEGILWLIKWVAIIGGSLFGLYLLSKVAMWFVELFEEIKEVRRNIVTFKVSILSSTDKSAQGLRDLIRMLTQGSDNIDTDCATLRKLATSLNYQGINLAYAYINKELSFDPEKASQRIDELCAAERQRYTSEYEDNTDREAAIPGHVYTFSVFLNISDAVEIPKELTLESVKEFLVYLNSVRFTDIQDIAILTCPLNGPGMERDEFIALYPEMVQL
jgi:hypothetical protein